jgi:signal transduction histidine kinase
MRPSVRLTSETPAMVRQWLAWGVPATAETALAAAALVLLTGWTPNVLTLTAVCGLPIFVALGAALIPGAGQAIPALQRQTLALLWLTVAGFTGYGVIVLGLGRVPTRNERAVVLLTSAATILMARAYVPARNRLRATAQRQRIAPATSDALIASLAGGMSRAIPLDEVLIQLAEMLRTTLVLSAAEVWTESGERLELAAADPYRPPRSVALSEGTAQALSQTGARTEQWIAIWLPELIDHDAESVRLTPITHTGRVLGAIVARRPSDAEPYTATDDALIGELARHIAPVLRNAELDSALHASLAELRARAEELRSSRARLITAADAERRRIERDLHDGVQQQLVALSLDLRLARGLPGVHAGNTDDVLLELEGKAEGALRDLRNLTHGIYPPLLMARGLEPALMAAAARLPFPVEIDVRRSDRYSQVTETALYFCCLEALQNVAKHAGERATACVRLCEEHGAVSLTVSDSGPGFDQRSAGVGSGLVGMQDRIGAIGGDVRIDSKPGSGTVVTAVVPRDPRTFGPTDA